MIDIGGPLHLLVVVGCCALAMRRFVAALQGWFLIRRTAAGRPALLLLICFTLFRPQFWMDMIYPPFNTFPAANMANIVGATPEGGSLRLRIQTTDISGEDVIKSVRLKLGANAQRSGTPVRPRYRRQRPDLAAGDHVGTAGIRSRTAEAEARRQDRIH